MRLLAAYLSLALLLAVSAYAGRQLARGGLLQGARWAIAVSLGAVAALWLLCNHPLEGLILFKLAPDRGLTTGDLLVLLPAALAARLVTGSRSG